MDVGFIGLGNMGRAMAESLVRAGHKVRVWNRSRRAVDEMAQMGAMAADAPGDAMGGDAVISMLADDGATRSIWLGAHLLQHAPKGIIHVNMATISVALARELTELHRQGGIAYVAAPVFGRPDVAAAGRLHIVAAGEPAAVDRVQPLFDAMGQKTWRAGTEPARANVVKLAGNFMLIAAIEAMAEAAALGQANGVAARDLIEIMSNTLFTAPLYKAYGALIVEQRYDPPAFRLGLGLKDVRLALAAADASGVPMAVASVLHDTLLEAVSRGDGDRDLAALAEVARRRAGLDRRP
jgi:3-hydroxyisobutyrate dehydrogenase-like beta-hydroxyacid dehydrogenase